MKFTIMKAPLSKGPFKRYVTNWQKREGTASTVMFFTDNLCLFLLELSFSFTLSYEAPIILLLETIRKSYLCGSDSYVLTGQRNYNFTVLLAGLVTHLKLSWPFLPSSIWCDMLKQPFTRKILSILNHNLWFFIE